MNPKETYSAIENLLNEWQSQAEQKAIDSQKLVDDIAQVEVVAESQDRCVRTSPWPRTCTTSCPVSSRARSWICSRRREATWPIRSVT